MILRITTAVLVTLILLSALSLVFVRHHSRVTFIGLQRLNVQRDHLNEQWSKLLLEQATWSGRRIELKARTELRLQSPGAGQIRYIVVQPQ